MGQSGRPRLCKAEGRRGSIEKNHHRGSSLVAKLNQKSSIQIALRLPEADLAQARKLADRKGLGYQTLLKMMVHEGLRRGARRG